MGFGRVTGQSSMNDYGITIEEVIVHDAHAQANTPVEAFEQIRSRYETGEFDVPGECQETRIAVRKPTGEILIDFEKI